VHAAGAGAFFFLLRRITIPLMLPSLTGMPLVAALHWAAGVLVRSWSLVHIGRD
jgi:hypothetical protein